MSVIEVSELTKEYAFNKGIFNINFNVEKGETVGFLGPNGAGKSTTMRHLMGFSIPDFGYAKIMDYDCIKEYTKTKQNIGYLPGEPTLPQGLSGKAFVEMMEGLRNKYNNDRVKYLCEKFELDLNQDIKKMSIGERRKLAIVTAFMNDPEVLLLDEPTSGLDPKMQEVFIEFIEEEKKRGKTILLSSHIFREVERLCDKILIIKDGKIVASIDKENIKEELKRRFTIIFNTEIDYDNFYNEGFKIDEAIRSNLKISIFVDDMDKTIKTISKYDFKDIKESTISLEDYFMKFYRKDGSLYV